MSGFHPDELLKSLSRYPVVKYELAGHAFNGNQYTAGKTDNIVSRAAKVASDRIGGAPNRADALSMAEYHRGEAAKAMAARNETGYKDVADNLNALAKAHLAAQKTWTKVADYSNRNVGADASKAVNQTMDAVNHYGNADLPK
jgi:hypothetical protein